MKSSKKDFFPAVSAIAVMASTLILLQPYFRAYLRIPNHNLLPWDMALHAKDGIVFYLQAKRLDFLSFLYTFISLSFWMPLHPFLIALTSIFFPFQASAYVYLNFLSLALGMGFTVYLVSRAKRINIAGKLFFALGLIYWIMRQSNSSAFWGTHLNVMIESLAVGLTFAFVTSSLLESDDPEQKDFYVKTSLITLTFLSFTKVQYSLFFGAAYFLKLLCENQTELKQISLNPLKTGFFRAKVLILFLLGIAAYGISALFFSKAEFIWAFAFDALLVCTWTVVSKQTVIQEFKASLPKDLLRFIKIAFIPFGWYFLFPFRNKVRFLLFNAQGMANPETLSRKFRVLFSDLSVFISAPIGFAVLLVGIIFLASIVNAIKAAPAKRYLALYPLVLLLSFYLPMSLFAGMRLERFTATWVAAIGICILFLFMRTLRVSAALLLASALLVVGITHEYRSAQDSRIADMTKLMEVHGYLAPDWKSLDQVLGHFDFHQPGIIYGLGSSMDLSTPFFDLKVLEAHPEYSSVFSKREDRELIANDFGHTGNDHPAEIILKRAENKDLKQIVLYPSGFKPEDFSALIFKLKGSGYPYRSLFENPDVVFLVR